MPHVPDEPEPAATTRPLPLGAADWQDTVEVPLLPPAPPTTTVVLAPQPPPPPVPAPPPPPAPASARAAAPWAAAPWAPGWPLAPFVVTDRRDYGVAAPAAAWFATVLTLGYLLPWAVALSRGRSNQAGVAIVTVLTGWTGVGWIAALVMACSAHQVATVVLPVPVPWPATTPWPTDGTWTAPAT